MITAPVLVAGEELDAPGDVVVNPARTDETVGRYALGGPTHVDAAVRAAHAAFPAWAALTAAERAARLVRAADELDARTEERAVLLTRETGKVLGESRVDAAGAAGLLRSFASLAALVDTEEHIATGIGPAIVHHVPMGPVGVIAPWNTPVLLAFMAIGPALIAGNTAVVKPPEDAPLALSQALATVARSLPPGVLNSVPGRGEEAGAALAAHPLVRKVLFTGSMATGRAVMRAAAGNLKSLGMELGGNDAALVLESADITEELAREFIAGVFSASGQICYNVKRIYVHRSRHRAFVDAFTELASQIVVGNGLDPRTHMGPLATRAGFERVRDLREAAAKAGAQVTAVGVQGDPDSWDRGWFQLPTVVTGIDPGAELVTTEQFGPIIPILAFDDEDEAVRLANDTEYGLAGSVWSSDIDHATALARRLACGSAFVNVHRVGASPMDVPFGGMKQSGIGRNHGLPSVRACQEPQAVIRVDPPGALPGIQHWSGLTLTS
ncbi:aldehyde dehydrogenase family protein [Streptomyces spiralis]|uniref:aldehyde dehydrogenase family protein n=1 Tax=Streptomyces spiralis TaxID=66376 RepID=UPI0033E4600D